MNVQESSLIDPTLFDEKYRAPPELLVARQDVNVRLIRASEAAEESVKCNAPPSSLERQEEKVYPF